MNEEIYTIIAHYSNQEQKTLRVEKREVDGVEKYVMGFGSNCIDLTGKYVVYGSLEEVLEKYRQYIKKLRIVVL